MYWQLEIILTWPHDRFALGWEYIGPTEDDNVSTFRVFFFVFTFALHLYHE